MLSQWNSFDAPNLQVRPLRRAPLTSSTCSTFFTREVAMRNDARPVGEEFGEIAEHDPQNGAKDREPAEGARYDGEEEEGEHEDREHRGGTRQPDGSGETLPDSSDR
jgi:hypothetical protein